MLLTMFCSLPTLISVGMHCNDHVAQVKADIL